MSTGARSEAVNEFCYILAFALVSSVASLVATAAEVLLDLPTRAGVAIFLALVGAFYLGNVVGVWRAALTEREGGRP